MTSNIQVLMRVPNKEEGSDDAVCEIEIGENIFAARGNPELVCDMARGFSHLFFMDANEDVSSPYDFAGEIRREKDGRLPSAEVKLERMLDKGRKWYSSVFIRIGNQAMKFGCDSWNEAENIAHALVEVLGLKKADRAGKRYVGPMQIVQEAELVAC